MKRRVQLFSRLILTPLLLAALAVGGCRTPADFVRYEAAPDGAKVPMMQALGDCNAKHGRSPNAKDSDAKDSDAKKPDADKHDQCMRARGWRVVR